MFSEVKLIIGFTIFTTLTSFFFANGPNKPQIIDVILNLLKHIFTVAKIIALNHITKGHKMLGHIPPTSLSRGSTHDFGPHLKVMQSIVRRRISGVLFSKGLCALAIKFFKASLKIFVCHV